MADTETKELHEEKDEKEAIAAADDRYEITLWQATHHVVARQVTAAVHNPAAVTMSDVDEWKAWTERPFPNVTDSTERHSMWLSVQSLVYSLDILHVPNKATNPIEVKRDELQKMLQDYASKIEPEDRAQMEKILQCQDTCKQLTDIPDLADVETSAAPPPQETPQQQQLFDDNDRVGTDVPISFSSSPSSSSASSSSSFHPEPYAPPPPYYAPMPPSHHMHTPLAFEHLPPEPFLGHQYAGQFPPSAAAGPINTRKRNRIVNAYQTALSVGAPTSSATAPRLKKANHGTPSRGKQPVPPSSSSSAAVPPVYSRNGIAGPPPRTIFFPRMAPQQQHQQQHPPPPAVDGRYNDFGGGAAAGHFGHEDGSVGGGRPGYGVFSAPAPSVYTEQENDDTVDAVGVVVGSEIYPQQPAPRLVATGVKALDTDDQVGWMPPARSPSPCPPPSLYLPELPSLFDHPFPDIMPGEHDYLS